MITCSSDRQRPPQCQQDTFPFTLCFHTASRQSRKSPVSEGRQRGFRWGRRAEVMAGNGDKDGGCHQWGSGGLWQRGWRREVFRMALTGGQPLKAVLTSHLLWSICSSLFFPSWVLREAAFHQSTVHLKCILGFREGKVPGWGGCWSGALGGCCCQEGAAGGTASAGRDCGLSPKQHVLHMLDGSAASARAVQDDPLLKTGIDNSQGASDTSFSLSCLCDTLSRPCVLSLDWRELPGAPLWGGQACFFSLTQMCVKANSTCSI